MRQLIREQDPKMPSVRFSTVEREKSVNLAGLRRTDIRALERRLHGKLDWITLKAMDKDRTHRYQTAYALAEDIQRYLNQEPVLAGPPSTIYKFRKFATRNKGIFVSVATIAVVIVLSAIISVVLAIKATRAEKAETVQRQKAEEAQRVAEQAQKATEFLSKKQEEDLYFNHIKLAHQELQDNRPMNALKLLDKCPEHLRNWEWNYLYRRSHVRETKPLEFAANVMSFDLSPDVNWLRFLTMAIWWSEIVRREESLPLKLEKKRIKLSKTIGLVGKNGWHFVPMGNMLQLLVTTTR